ncbi:MAG TPA: recombinase RecA, partial [Casimicrobium sp.]|nr:recombinase RecA [Casimicrobium sp.]
SGAWYSAGGNRIGQGRDNAREYLRENPALSKEIEDKIRDKVGITIGGAVSKDEGSPDE